MNLSALFTSQPPDIINMLLSGSINGFSISCPNNLHMFTTTRGRNFFRTPNQKFQGMCKILLEGANEWKKMGRHSII
ncbi:hypothetical protein BF29_459 [Heyndrickxia coagulans DSM 1 = ATCC 7050]|nr:hypothetical protein BF29_459 [Heyndrickxia coagulans DSM 1 = ATCC 7050]